MPTTLRGHPSGNPQELLMALPVDPRTWKRLVIWVRADSQGTKTSVGNPRSLASDSKGSLGSTLKHFTMSTTQPAISAPWAHEYSIACWMWNHSCFGLLPGMFPSKVWGTRPSRNRKHCLALILAHTRYVKVKIQMGRYWFVVFASGVFAKAATIPVTTCDGHGAPFSTSPMMSNRSSRHASGMWSMSRFETPSGPTAEYFFFLATAFRQISLVIFGKTTGGLGGKAARMKSKIVSHVVGSRWSCFFHRGLHSFSNWSRICGTSPITCLTTRFPSHCFATASGTTTWVGSTTWTLVGIPWTSTWCRPSGIGWASSISSCCWSRGSSWRIGMFCWTTMVWTGSARSRWRSL